jgi:spore coat protein U-like protein
MKKFIITLFSVVELFSLHLNAYAQTHSINANPKATATLAANCTISTQNVSFGTLILPLAAQSASSSMSVLCSKNASYKVGLAYGGIYGAGTNGNYWKEAGCKSSDGSCFAYGSWWDEYNSSGTKISSQELNWQQGQIPSGVIIPANFQTSSIDLTSQGALINNVVLQVGTAYGYGELIGVASADHVGYFIQVPNQPSEVWNTNEYSYSATGTGVAQSIPVVATIVPSQSGHSYPTPDTYMDVVTATVSY